ncbi:polyadenylate-binding protein 7 [Artemisia annua]|uniref:Polyadenylate-binding protein n=1 Tax=Artemisia annua TaxID=35608 RepID=A0A2U1KNY3_ARTAN|nr:polyadenylate-binding protein 7 [Artemisia annua]
MASPSSPLSPPSSSSLVVPASLYVGDLHHEINDARLHDAFAEYKSLSSVRVCRDSATGRSLCYGYVNFMSPQDATRAIEDKNNTMLCGKMIRVTKANRDPDVRKNGIGNVFVKNVNESMDNVQLRELFQNFGNILSCKVSTFEDGKSKGYGFVQFETEESSNAAIENLNGTNVGGKQIYVAKFMKKSDRLLSGPAAKYTNLYIKNLDLDMTEDLIKEKFSMFGNIVSLVIAREENGTSKGFGFVSFENPDDAKKAATTMNGANLGAKALYVGRAQKKSEREQILRHQFEEWRKEQISKCQGSNVYVKNIDDDVTENELQECFSQCGTITSAKLMVNEKGISKGFGFVCFSAPHEATKAVNTFNGYMFHGKPLYVAIAQRKEERQAQLQIHYAQRMAGIASPSAIVPSGYPPFYYPGIFSQMYQPMSIRSGWRSNTFAHPARTIDTSSYSSIFDARRLHRQNTERINGHTQPQLISTYVSSQQAGSNRGIASNSGGPPGDGSEMLSSMLSTASPEIQKQMLGERLYPLVYQHEPDLAAKITGMLLEMDNMKLILLLESPASLAAKVEEAVQVLKLSNRTNVSSQESLHTNLLTAQVAVN